MAIAFGFGGFDFAYLKSPRMKEYLSVINRCLMVITVLLLLMMMSATEIDLEYLSISQVDIKSKSIFFRVWAIFRAHLQRTKAPVFINSCL